MVCWHCRGRPRPPVSGYGAGSSSGTPQDDMTGWPGAIFIAIAHAGCHRHHQSWKWGCLLAWPGRPRPRSLGARDDIVRWPGAVFIAMTLALRRPQKGMKVWTPGRFSVDAGLRRYDGVGRRPAVFIAIGHAGCHRHPWKMKMAAANRVRGLDGGRFLRSRNPACAGMTDVGVLPLFSYQRRVGAGDGFPFARERRWWVAGFFTPHRGGRVSNPPLREP